MRHGSGQALSEVQAGPFHVSRTIHRRGLRLGMHAHDTACFHYVTDGVYHERVPGRTLAVARGLALLKPPHLRHCNAFTADAHSLRIDFPVEACGDTRAALPARPVVADDPRVARTAQRILVELGLADDCTVVAVHGLCLQLVALLARDARGSRGPVPDAVHRCEAFLREHFREPLCFSELAGCLGVSRSHLARSFQRHRGDTMGEFVRRLRVDRARELLERTALPIAEVAAEAGFADQSHLTRVFRASTGSTPAAWRQAFQASTPVQDTPPGST